MEKRERELSAQDFEALLQESENRRLEAVHNLERERIARQVAEAAEERERIARQAAEIARQAAEIARQAAEAGQERERIARQAAEASLRMLGDDTTFEELLDSMLPNFVDLSSTSRSSTKAVGARKPVRVLFWDLREEMTIFRQTLSESLMSTPAKKMTTPGITGSFSAVHEGQIVAFFLESAGKALDMLCKLKGDSVSMTAACGYSKCKRQNPDIFCCSEGSAIICGEVKRGNLTLAGHNLAERYQADDIIVKDTVHQLAGYQVDYDAEIGFFTNYFFTWITKLTIDGDFWISNPFEWNEVGPRSTLNALLFAVSSALESKQNGTWVPPSLEMVHVSVALEVFVSAGAAATGPDQGGERSEPSSTESSEIPSNTLMLSLESVLQRHPDRITYKARTTENGNLVAVKCYESREFRDSEACIYSKLASLQGSHIPRYLGSGLFGDGDTSRRFALILSWVGEDLEDGEIVPPLRAWKQAREALLEIHALGVVHGDIELRNVTYDTCSSRVFLCDFSHAITSGALGPAKFEAARAHDLNCFDRLMAVAAHAACDEVSIPLLRFIITPWDLSSSYGRERHWL
jgi:hypothetical protein